LIHAELALLCDVVLAAETAEVQDPAAFHQPAWLWTGSTWFSLCCSRGRYFLFTGDKIAASVAKMLGLVGKVPRRDKVLPRA
jgi:enoyl-CoA hydratase/carnithine racemase